MFVGQRLSNFAEKNLYPSLLFGFCNDLATYDGFLALANGVQKTLHCDCEVRMVSPDFSAAIDSVFHEALIYKLRLLV